MRLRISTLALVFTLAFVPRTGRAGEPAAAGTLQEVAQSAAEEVLKITKDQSVAIGQITPTGLPDNNGGPAIEELLKVALEKLHKGVVQRVAPFEVKGDFLKAPHPDKEEAALGQKVVKLILRIIDAASGESNNLIVTRFIVDNTSIARLLEPSGPLSLPQFPREDTEAQTKQRRIRNPEIFKLTDQPRSFVDPAHPTLIGSVPESPYRIEILAGPLGDVQTRPAEARPARLENDLAFVDVQRDEVYEIKFHNNSPEEVAVQLFIDGLSVFHFSDDRNAEGGPRLAYFIVPPHSTETVQGWHKSIAEEKYLAFLVVALGHGAAGQAGIPAHGKVGVVQAQVSRSHPVAANDHKRSPSNETGFGPPRRVKQEVVKREVEPPIDLIGVRYTR